MSTTIYESPLLYHVLSVDSYLPLSFHFILFYVRLEQTDYIAGCCCTFSSVFRLCALLVYRKSLLTKHNGYIKMSYQAAAQDAGDSEREKSIIRKNKCEKKTIADGNVISHTMTHRIHHFRLYRFFILHTIYG